MRKKGRKRRVRKRRVRKRGRGWKRRRERKKKGVWGGGRVKGNALKAYFFFFLPETSATSGPSPTCTVT